MRGVVSCLAAFLLCLKFATNIAAAETTYFHQTDHLRSPRVTTDQFGAAASVYEYLPFGQTKLQDNNSALDEQRRFSGHQLDPASGLYYLGARYLDPALTRFISHDPVYRDSPGSVLADPQQLNAYAYGRQNPLRHYDEAGEAAKDFIRHWPTVPLLAATGEAISQNNRPVYAFNNGEAMGSYKGVSLLSNGLKTGTGSGPLRQQCVGFAKEFYKQVYGITIGRVGDATGLGTLEVLNSATKDNIGSRSFTEFRNGLSTVRPKDDDIIGWRGGENGHVGIVASAYFNEKINRGFIDVVEQNWGQGSINQGGISRHELTRDAKTGAYGVADRGKYKVYNWMRLAPRQSANSTTSK